MKNEVSAALVGASIMGLAVMFLMPLSTGNTTTIGVLCVTFSAIVIGLQLGSKNPEDEVIEVYYDTNRIGGSSGRNRARLASNHGIHGSSTISQLQALEDLLKVAGSEGYSTDLQDYKVLEQSTKHSLTD